MTQYQFISRSKWNRSDTALNVSPLRCCMPYLSQLRGATSRTGASFSKCHNATCKRAPLVPTSQRRGDEPEGCLGGSLVVWSPAHSPRQYGAPLHRFEIGIAGTWDMLLDDRPSGVTAKPVTLNPRPAVGCHSTNPTISPVGVSINATTQPPWTRVGFTC